MPLARFLLPVSLDEARRNYGWTEFDVVIVSGDAYVDHPSFGAAIVGRWLQHLGLRVGIIAQPDWRNVEEFSKLGRPRLFFGVTAGALDSLVANYTAQKRKRSDDAYAPGGRAGGRPDRAVTVYGNLIRRAFGKHVDASRLFLYKATRNLLSLKGDSGAYLRTTMGALVLFGVPPEKFWPYEEKDVEKEPPAFCYAFAANYHTMSYFSLDPPGTKPAELIERIKTYLASGVPSMFGFTVYTSIDQAGPGGEIPFPGAKEKVAGGHAIVAVGYDDAKKIRNKEKGAKETVGAFLIRNSWGEGWGDKGYGWLPYDYVSAGLAEDWWTLIKAEWVDSGEFGL